MIDVSAYQLFYSAHSTLELDNYPGFIWRGALGTLFKKNACTTGYSECKGCELTGSCAYSQVFNANPTPYDEYRPGSPPNPYVITSWHNNRIQSGDVLEVNLVLVGRANVYAPYVLKAMAEITHIGIGQQRGQVRLQQIIQSLPDGEDRLLVQEGRVVDKPLAPREVAAPPLDHDRVRVILESPLSLKLKGKPMSAAQLTGQRFCEGVARRIFDLGKYWCQPISNKDELYAACRAVDTQVTELQDWKLERFSSRQRKGIDMSGVIGELELDISHALELWPLLWAGQWAHVGKGAVMGLGRYSLSGID